MQPNDQSPRAPRGTKKYSHIFQNNKKKQAFFRRFWAKELHFWESATCLRCCTLAGCNSHCRVFIYIFGAPKNLFKKYCSTMYTSRGGHKHFVQLMRGRIIPHIACKSEFRRFFFFRSQHGFEVPFFFLQKNGPGDHPTRFHANLWSGKFHRDGDKRRCVAAPPFAPALMVVSCSSQRSQWHTWGEGAG